MSRGPLAFCSHSLLWSFIRLGTISKTLEALPQQDNRPPLRFHYLMPRTRGECPSHFRRIAPATTQTTKKGMS